MNICLVVAARPLRWHLLVAELLSVRKDFNITIARAEVRHEWPGSLQVLTWLERLIYRGSSGTMTEAIDAQHLPLLRDVDAKTPFDLTISLVGNDPLLPVAHRILTTHFDDQVTEIGAVHALLDERPFSIGVIAATSTGSRRFDYPAAVEDPRIIARSLDNVCSRMADLLRVHAIDDQIAAGGGVSRIPSASNDTRSATELLAHMLDTLKQKLARRLRALAYDGDRWAVGWRETATPLLDAPSCIAKYKLMRDDGRRYYADPFLFASGGKRYMFVEELPFATRKGVISVCEITSSGPTTPRVIIEQPHHLSYPQVFEDGGEIWMIPESGYGGSIDLYRAEGLPGPWRLECRLVDNIVALDPSLYRDATGYWLFTTSAISLSTTSDRLSVYHAPALRGPWRLVEPDPMLVDPKYARGAGMIRRVGNRIVRPVQDCTEGYGSSITFCAMSHPGQGRVTQTALATLSTVERRRFWGAHTYNFEDGFEVVDAFGFPRSGSGNVELALERTANPALTNTEVQRAC